jgi:hypothetical protein
MSYLLRHFTLYIDHQTLLCDIGIIETVLQIIVVPFDLAKRKRVRDKLSKSSKHIGILEYPSE